MNDKIKIKIEEFDELPSTNDYAKAKRKEGRDLVVVAAKQSSGRGTKGRSFLSKTGGLYLSKLTFYRNMPAKRAFTVMAGAAVAVCKTLESFGLSPVIKWANDIHVNGKKICGILVENTFSGQEISSSVVGIGINVNNELDEEIAGIATSIKTEIRKEVPLRAVKERLIEELAQKTEMREYIDRVGYMGREAELIFQDCKTVAVLRSVDEEGGLWIEENGALRRVTAAEVSIRVGR